MTFKKLALGAVLAVCALITATAQANIIDWTITGPGTLTETNVAPGLTKEAYQLSGIGSQSWTVSGLATDAGDYTFAWDYTGFHSYFRVTAFLTAFSPAVTLVSAGPTSCCDGPPSGGFSYNGIYTFSNVAAGDIIGFNLGGSHGDSARTFDGTLTLEQDLPEPAGLALVALGLVGLVASRRRASK